MGSPTLTIRHRVCAPKGNKGSSFAGLLAPPPIPKDPSLKTDLQDEEVMTIFYLRKDGNFTLTTSRNPTGGTKENMQDNIVRIRIVFISTDNCSYPILIFPHEGMLKQHDGIRGRHHRTRVSM